MPSQPPLPDSLAAWLERTPSAGLRLGRVRLGSMHVQTIEGLGKLQFPWREGLVLRMHWLNVSQLRLHAFHGTSGATLVYYDQRPHGWAAYLATRAAPDVTPQTLALTGVSTNTGATNRLNEIGPLDLFCHHNTLVLAVGPRRLLAVPLPGPPTDLYVEGRAMVGGLALAKVTDLDADPAAWSPIDPPPADSATTSIKPAEQPWTIWNTAKSNKNQKKQDRGKSATGPASQSPADIQPERLSDGGLRWAAGRRSAEAWYTSLPRDTPYLLDVQLENVVAGCGIYLGDAQGQPVCLVRVVHDRRRKLQAVVWQDLTDSIEVSLPAWQEQPVALVGGSLWLRLAAGCGQVRFWVSPDGQHWVEPNFPKTVSSLPVTTWGVALPAEVPTAAVTIRQAVVRPLKQLAALVESVHPDASVSWSSGQSVAQWLAWAEQQRPPAIPRQAWYGRLALRTLAGGAPAPLGHALLEALLDDAAGRGVPLERQVGALEEALLLVSDLRDGGAMRQGLAGRLMRLGLRAAEEGDWSQCDRIQGILESLPPIRMHYAVPDTSRLVRWQWVDVAYADRDGRSEKLRQWQRYAAGGNGRLGEWALWQRARQGAGEGGGVGVAPWEGGGSVSEAWRDLLVEETDAEAFGIVAELAAAVHSAAWDDAARIVMQIEPHQAGGLAACPWEAGLWATVRQTVELACQRFPPLRQAIAQRYGAWGREWVEQAIAAGQRERIDLAAWQLAGTAAARRAQRWLADQALADGAFAEALKHYDALTDDPLAAAEVGPRRRLAAAFLGRDAGDRPTRPVVLGQQTLSPEEFETLVHEVRQRTRPAATQDRPAEAALPPGTLEVRTLAASVGIIAPRPAESTASMSSTEDTWALRHLASLSDGPWLLTSSRRQFVGTELPAGRRVWTEPPSDRLPQSGEFLGTPMVPVAAGGRLYARWLVGAETRLVCLDAATGQVLWRWEPTPVVISDPVLVGDSLVVLGLSRQPQQQLRVHAYVLDPLSGAVRRRSDLVLVREVWAARDCVLVAGDEDGLVAALGGVSLGLDPDGKLRWVRTHLAVPREVDPLWVVQRFQPPLIDREHVFLAQPGVWTVDCLHRASGQRPWQRVLPELVGLIGLTEGTLVVRCLDEILGLDARTGTLRWRHSQTDVLDGLITGRHVLLFRRGDASTGKLRPVEAIWLEGQTGRLVGSVPVPKLEGAAPAVGGASLTPHGLALWFQPDGQRATARLCLLRTQTPLPADWHPPTPWEALTNEQAAP